MARSSWFLCRRLGQGVTLTQRPSGDAEYALLGIPMMDIQVLRSTQSLFTSTSIIVALLGSFLVITPPSPRKMFLGVMWFCCLSIVGTLSGSAYFGVKRSSAKLLDLYSCVSTTLA